MTEPLFFTTSVISLLSLSRHFQTKELNPLLLSAVMAAMALLTRFVGIAVIATGALSVISFSRRDLFKRVRDVVLFSVIASIPFIGWLVSLRTKTIFTGTSDFNLWEYWARLSPFKIEFMNIIWRWLRLDKFLAGLDYDSKLDVLILSSVLTFIILLFVSIKNKRINSLKNLVQTTSFQIFVIFLIFSVFFLVVTAFAFLFSPQLPEIPTERLLSPFLMGVFLAGSCLAVFILEIYPSNWVSNLLLTLPFVIFISCQIDQGLSHLSDLHENGSGFTSKYWQTSELIERTKELNQDTILISNETDALLLYLNRPAYQIPEIIQGKKIEDFKSFGYDSTDNIQIVFKERDAALVLFDTVYWQFNAFYYHRTEERLEAFTKNLCLHSEVADGEIYFYHCQ